MTLVNVLFPSLNIQHLFDTLVPKTMHVTQQQQGGVNSLFQPGSP